MQHVTESWSAGRSLEEEDEDEEEEVRDMTPTMCQRTRGDGWGRPLPQRRRGGVHRNHARSRHLPHRQRLLTRYFGALLTQNEPPDSVCQPASLRCARTQTERRKPVFTVVLQTAEVGWEAADHAVETRNPVFKAAWRLLGAYFYSCEVQVPVLPVVLPPLLPQWHRMTAAVKCRMNVCVYR